MITLHLLIEDDYVQTLVDSLPKDKVRIIEEDFEQNKQLLKETFNEYNNNNESIPYSQSMNNITQWLNEREK